MRTWIALVVVTAALSIAASARAQQSDDVKEAEARFASGQGHMGRSEYAPAIADFEEAYRRNPDPKYLFSLGEANRFAGNPERARFYYKSYVDNVPDASNRAEVDADIATVEQQIAAKKAAAEAPPPPPKPAVVAPAPVTAAPAAAVTASAPPRPEKKSKAWIAGVVIPVVLVAGAGVALGVYFGTRDTTNTFPGASF
jgi:tetratricopeptide (TPR) repeat protein